MRAIVAAATALLVIGCGKKPTLIFDQPQMPTEGRYETAWVDPELIVSDTFFTLIRSERIDSVYKDKQDPFARLTPSLEFHLAQGDCVVSLNLLDSRLRLIHPLVVKVLSVGHYKLTFHPDLFDGFDDPVQSYYLQADYCGETARQVFIAD